MKRPEPRDEHSPALDWVVSSGSVDRVFDEVAVQLRRRRRRRVLVAAGAAAVLLVIALAWPMSRPSAPMVSPSARAAAVAQAPARQTLPDGSVVELTGRARIVVNFDGATRRVALLRGQAHFQVAKDAAHPFVVSAGGVEVRAVGTAFSVDFAAQTVEVFVTEGRVAVESRAVLSASSAPSAPTFVDAGSRIIVDLDANAATAAVPVVARAPRVVLSGTPLAKAIAMFNQHARVPLVLDDPSLGAVELSGVLRADNTDALLQLLKEQFGIVGERRDSAIVLHK